MLAIIVGLNQGSVTRLKETWKVRGNNQLKFLIQSNN